MIFLKKIRDGKSVLDFDEMFKITESDLYRHDAKDPFKVKKWHLKFARLQFSFRTRL